MEPQHDHPRTAACPPSCPAWAEGALSSLALQRRYPEMLEACRAAAAIEYLDVVPETQGVVLPEYLITDKPVRLNMVVGRDTPEVLLDAWGVRCNLTFSGRRYDCALPWPSVSNGLLRPPQRRRPRFGVIDGTDDAPPPEVAPAAAAPAPAGGAAPPETRPSEPGPAGRPRRFGVIEGGKGKKD